MIHLSAARLWKPEASSLFYLGNVAPDGSPDRERKDIAHLRLNPKREAALCEMRNTTDKSDDFALGVLMHLFLDWKWDDSALVSFKKSLGEDWFLPYRNEIAKASSWLFHHNSWSDGVWRDLMSVPLKDYGFVPGAGAQEVTEMLDRNYNWHVSNDIGPSDFYRLEYVDDFIIRTASDFEEWLHNRKNF